MAAMNCWGVHNLWKVGSCPAEEMDRGDAALSVKNAINKRQI